MTTYKKYITIEDPERLVLSGLPFSAGQQVELVLIARDEQKRDRLQELKALFKTTQALPQSLTISEDEIVAEIASYRAGKRK